MIRRRLALLGLILAALLPNPIPAAHAVTEDGTLSQCGVVSTPHRLDVNTTADYTFQVTNTDSIPIQWVRIVSPSDSFSFINGQADGWVVSSNSEEVLFQGSTIEPGATTTFTTTVATGEVKTEPQYWEVMASNDVVGDAAIDCTGDTMTAVGLLGPPAIANVGVFNITPSSATVFWTTDRPTASEVDYGKTTAYGATASSPTLTTTHSLSLSGLKANTGYHFRLVSAADDGSIGYSGDNTFLTTSPVAPITITVPISNPNDTAPPTVALTSTFPRALNTAPVVTGQAADNYGITRVEYSTNGGLDWLSANLTSQTAASSKHGATATFSFTPILPDDGNYTLLARATDVGGNQTTSAPVALVIDRLPPRFGSTTITIGPQTILPDEHGTVTIPTGVEYRLTTSVVGGPSMVTLTAAHAGDADSSTFGLSLDRSTGLWTGLVSFKRAGFYTVLASATDGAGNHASRQFAQFQVIPPLYLQNSAHSLAAGQLTLYFLQPTSHQWLIWDGRPYGQTNPQTTGRAGAISLFVPPGTYYAKLRSGATSVVTHSFTISQPTPLTGAVLVTAPSLHLGPFTVHLPWNNLVPAPLPGRITAPGAASLSSVGRILPLASLTATTGQTTTPASWYGKPTVVARIATWAPTTTDLLSALATVAANPDVNVVALSSQQPTETVAAYQKTTAYTGTLLTDPDGLLSDTLLVPASPTLYFIDRHGVIKTIVPGGTSAAQIRQTLEKL